MSLPFNLFHSNNIVSCVGGGHHTNRKPAIMYVIASLFLSLMSLSAAQDVLQPPAIIKPDRQQTLYFPQTSKVEILCEAQGSPRPSYVWQRGGVDIQPGDEFVTFNPLTGTLTIPNFSSREEGDYMCVASNTVGNNLAVSLSNPQKLVASRVSAFTKVPLRTVKVDQFSYAQLPCSEQNEVVGAPGTISKNWYLKSSQQVSMDNNRLFISTDGTLHFTYTEMKDHLASNDEYHCGITTIGFSSIQLGNGYRLDVNSASPKALRPLLRYSNRPVMASLGTEAQLECVFSGYEPTTPSRIPVIRWFDDAGQEVVSDGGKYTLSDGNRVLTVKDLDETDDRNYACEASTTAGVSQRENVLLNVTSAPLWVEPPKGTTVTVGRDVKINCKARSLEKEVQPSTPEWRINGQPYVARENTALSENSQVLTITDVSKEKDIMCLQCFVRNSIGQAMGDACLNVILPITVQAICEKCHNQDPGDCKCIDWNLVAGDAVILRFTTTTDPAYKDKLIYEWTVHDKAYRLPKLPPHMTFDTVNSEYTLKTEGLTEKEFIAVGGTYIFKVFHPFDSKSIAIDINLDGITGPSTSSAGFDLWIIGLVLGILILVIIIVVIIVCIVCRKMQEGDYNVDKKETNAGLDPAQEIKKKAFSDLSRPEYDFDDDKKRPEGRDLEYDDVPIGADDESLGEYGMDEVSHFNEEGSFIGKYSTRPQPTAPHQPQPHHYNNNNNDFLNQSNSTETTI